MCLHLKYYIILFYIYNFFLTLYLIFNFFHINYLTVFKFQFKFKFSIIFESKKHDKKFNLFIKILFNI